MLLLVLMLVLAVVVVVAVVFISVAVECMTPHHKLRLVNPQSLALTVDVVGR